MGGRGGRWVFSLCLVGGCTIPQTPSHGHTRTVRRERVADAQRQHPHVPLDHRDIYAVDHVVVARVQPRRARPGPVLV